MMLRTQRIMAMAARRGMARKKPGAVAVDVLTGLAGAWRLNEVSEGMDEPQRVDSSGNGHTLDPSGVTSGVPGLIGNALSTEFGGYVGKTGWILTGQPFTFAGWIKPGGGTDAGCVFSQLDDGEPIHQLSISGGPASFMVNGLNSITGGTITGGAWNHLVGVQSGTTSTLYVNGVEVATGTKTVATPSVARTTRIGSPGGIWVAPMTPNLHDMVCVYSIALNAAQVAALYNSGAGRDPTA